MSDINIVLENRDDIHVAVEEKDINVEVPAGKDGRALRPRGEWSASAAYAYLDLVSYDGSSYVATKAVPAGTLPTDTSYWMLSAEKGDPGGAVWGNITGDLSDQTDLQVALDAKADVIISSASGNIASFSDGSPAPVAALSVAIEPVQDLHGYDNPWPAGGGKNLYDKAATNPDNGYVYNKYLGADGSLMDPAQPWLVSEYITVKPNTAYTLSGVYSQPVVYCCEYDANKNFVTSHSYATIPLKFTTASDTEYLRISRKPDDVGSGNPYAQLELGSTATTFSPYANVCPISGHSTATVTRTGKNVYKLAESYESHTYNTTVTYSDTGCVVEASGTYGRRGYCFPVVSGYRYTVSYKAYGTDANYKRIFYGTKNKAWGTMDDGYLGFQQLTDTSTSYSYSFTATSTDIFFFGIYVTSNSSSGSITVTDFQLELGSTASAYEPYQGTSVTISLGEERYGGTLDVTTGMLTVTKVGIIFKGTENVTAQTIGGYRRFNLYNAPYSVKGISGYHISSMYVPSGSLLSTNTVNNAFWWAGTSIVWRDDAFGSANAMKTELARLYSVGTPFTVVGELGTPITIQLTPSQISTLLGQNNIWADTGDTNVEYRADTKLYIDGKFSQLQALILEN